MIERNDAADDAARLAHGEVHHTWAHRDRGAFHFRHQAGVKLDLRSGDGCVHHHLMHGIAAVGGVDHREFVGVFPQDRGDALEQARALERRRVAPAVERLLRRLHGSVDVVGAAIGERAE